LGEILKNTFPGYYNEILALAYYNIMQNEPTYLFPYWLDEQYLPTVKKMHSSDISNLYDQIGGMQRQRLEIYKTVDRTY